MFHRFLIFSEFVKTSARLALHVREVLVSLVLLLIAGGWVISKVEHIKLSDAIYFSFITALSIGYGDISPTTGIGKLVSVVIGLIGMLFVGITVAIATRAVAVTAKKFLEDQSSN